MLDNIGTTRYTTPATVTPSIDTTMRSIVFTALALLFIGTFNRTAANDVQEIIDQIKEMKGQYTLTPENTLKTIIFPDGSKLTAEIFDLIARQPDLESLQIANYRELNDAIVAKLTGLKKLKTLGLTNSGMLTDNAIKMIAEAFPNLVNLDVSRNPLLTDAAAKEIAKLEQLENLNLLLCNFSELGIMYLAELEKL